MKITKSQIKAMQSIRHKVFPDDGQYHDWLDVNYGKSSTKDLTSAQAREAIGLLLRGIGQPVHTSHSGRAPHRTPGKWLTPRQYSKIKAIEKDLGWQDNPLRMTGFIRRQTNLNKTINMLTVSEAQKVITGLMRLVNDKVKE